MLELSTCARWQGKRGNLKGQAERGESVQIWCTDVLEMDSIWSCKVLYQRFIDGMKGASYLAECGQVKPSTKETT